MTLGTEQEAVATAIQEAQALKARWSTRNAKIEAIYRLRRLIPGTKLPGQARRQVFTSNGPRVFFNIARHMLAGKPFRVHTEMGDVDKDAERRTGVTERAILSIFRELDDAHWRRGLAPWRVSLADQVLMGWVNILYGVYRREDGAPEFVADIWDNLTVYPDWDEDGLVTVLHEYPVPLRAAYRMAQKKGHTLHQGRTGTQEPASVPVQDWWRREGRQVWHQVVLGTQEIEPAHLVSGLEEIPVICLPIGGESRRVGSLLGSQDSLDYIFASILDAGLSIAEEINQQMGLIKEVVKDNARLTYWDKTPDGQGALDIDEMRRGGSVQHLTSEDEVGNLAPGQTPPQTFDYLRMLQAEWQRATIPNTFFAEVAADTSGFLFSQLQAAAVTNIGPYNSAQSWVATVLAQAFANGFRDGGFSPITVKGRETDEGFARGYFMEEWSPQDVAPQLWLSVTSELAVPRNRIQEIATMRNANAGTPNLLDEVTLLDEIGGFADPLLIQERKRRDALANSQVAQMADEALNLLRQAEFYQKAGDQMAARVYAVMAERAMNSILPGQTSQPQPGVNPAAGGVIARNGQSPSVVRALLQRAPPQVTQRRGAPPG